MLWENPFKVVLQNVKATFSNFFFFLKYITKKPLHQEKTIYIYYQCNMCDMKCNSIKVENRIAICLLDWLIFCYHLRQVNQFFSLSNPTICQSILCHGTISASVLNTMLWWRILISIHTKLRLYFDFNQSNCYHISIIEYHVKITLVGGLIELFHFLTDYYI